MSNTTTPRNPYSSFFESAEVRLVPLTPWSQSDYKRAYVLVSSRIYWKVANEDGTNKPESFDDFRNTDSLELVRLDEGTWDDVKDSVVVDDYNGRTRIAVRGKIRRRTRRNYSLLGSRARIEILPNTLEQQEVWLNQIRARIAPWELLEQEIKDVVDRSPFSKSEELKQALDGLVTSRCATKPCSMSMDGAKGKRSEFFRRQPENMEKLSVVDKLTAQIGAGVGAGTALAGRVERVAETAKLIGDASRFAAGVSSIFQLVALAAQGASMWATAIQGQRLLPIALGRIGILLEYVLESMTEILKPSRDVHEVDIGFAFNALKQTICTMDMAETQLTRGRFSRFLNAKDVKEVEKKVEELTQMVVVAGNIWKISELDDKTNQSRAEHQTWNDGPHHVRPSVSAFFSGRKKELDTLNDLLEKRGSAVITQYGGVGKTELMVAFADRAERDGKVPGGVFWVTLHGSESNAIGSLAGLVEKLTSRKMSGEDRQNPNLVITALKEGLGKTEGRWLLCLDNADDSKVSGILNGVCGPAGSSLGNGWVIVTSRQGQPHIWDRMKSEQKLILEPLSTEDAMVALWRKIRKIETADADDEQVLAEIKQLEDNDQAEYCALKKLCGDDSGRGLGGLPLAIVQAGSYIAQFDCSFVQYLNLFESSDGEDGKDVMNTADDLNSIRPSQKSIWTTWKISVQKLTGKARAVLRAMAMLGQGGVGEAIVNEILETSTRNGDGNVESMFRNVVKKELMHGSSLIRCGEEEGRKIYGMHRLVRRFILNDMVRGSAVWNDMYSSALLAVHEVVKTELGKTGDSFDDFPDVFERNHYEFAAHSLSLVHHYVLPVRGGEIQNVGEVEDIHQYSGMVMQFMGKWEEGVEVWKYLLAVLHHQYEIYKKPKGNWSGRLLGMRHRRNQRGEVDRRKAGTYNKLGHALMRTEKLNSAVSKLTQSLEIYEAIHGHGKPQIEIALALNNLGLVYSLMGKLDKALEKHEQSLEMRQAIHGQGNLHPDIAMSFNNLGIVYHRMGKLDKALENHQQSLEISLGVHGPGKPHRNISMSLSNLGLVYSEMGQLDKALEKHEQAHKMEIAIRGRGTAHPDIAMSFNNLGSLYRKMGQLDKALELLEQGLKMRQAILGHSKPHLDIAICLNNLGLVYRETGKLDEALEKHKLSLEIYQAIHEQGKPHPDVAMCLNNLGLVYEEMGELNKAMEKHEQSLEMRRAIHGNAEPHPDIANSLHNIGNVFCEKGELNKALEKHEQTLELRRAIYGQANPHVDIASSLNNLGKVYRRMGNLDEALEKYKQSLDMMRAIYGHDKPHLDIAMSLDNLGNVHLQKNNLDEALEKYEESLSMRQMIHGHGRPHADIASMRSKMGLIYEQLSDLKNALENYELSLEMYRAIHGFDKTHVDIASALFNLAHVYEKTGELEKALEKHEESLEMYRAIYGRSEPHSKFAIALYCIGAVHRLQKNLNRANEFLKECLEMLQMLHGQNSLHPFITAVRSQLADIFDDQGRRVEALALRALNTMINETSDGVESNHSVAN